MSTFDILIGHDILSLSGIYSVYVLVIKLSSTPYLGNHWGWVQHVQVTYCNDKQLWGGGRLGTHIEVIERQGGQITHTKVMVKHYIVVHVEL